MPVEQKHEQYSANLQIWNQVSAFCEGENVVKSFGEQFLPKESKWSDDDYQNYLSLAPFTGFTARTLETMMGAVYRKEPVFTVPNTININNVDGNGNGLTSLSKRVTSEVIKNGRCGVLVDLGDFEDDSPTIESAKNKQAYCKVYPPQSIINWADSKIVLLESYDVSVDEFTSTKEDQYRVLDLDEQGFYRVRIFRNSEVYETYEPRNFSGQRLSYIPFTFVGSVNNDSDVDKSPLFEISGKNKTHYVLGADVMRSVRLVGTPMLHIDFGDMSFDTFKSANNLSDGKGFQFGSSSGIITSNGGSVNMIQAQANSMASEERDKTLEEAVMIGARMIMKGSAVMTAEQARMELSAETSQLSQITSNIEGAIQTVLNFMVEFVGGNQATFEINKEFFDLSVDAQMLTVITGLADRGYISQLDILNILKRNGFVDADKELSDLTDELTQINAV
jgi:hypothetical protein